jgi:uncharacterized SAM-binding protein YcdF (DUF218 family)
VSGLILCVGMAGAAAISGEALVTTRHLTDPDAILALASHEWERLPEASRLALIYPDARVLLTEPVRPTAYNCYKCAERREWLASLGVDEARIVLLPRRVQNTYDEAVAAREYSREHGIHRLMIVTSPYHTRRTFATFSSVFSDVPIALGVLAGVESPARPDRWWMASYDRGYVAYEWAALVWYAVGHQVSPIQ